MESLRSDGRKNEMCVVRELFVFVRVERFYGGPFVRLLIPTADMCALAFYVCPSKVRRAVVVCIPQEGPLDK